MSRINCTSLLTVERPRLWALQGTDLERQSFFYTNTLRHHKKKLVFLLIPIDSQISDSFPSWSLSFDTYTSTINYTFRILRLDFFLGICLSMEVNLRLMALPPLPFQSCIYSLPYVTFFCEPHKGHNGDLYINQRWTKVYEPCSRTVW